MGKLNRVYVVIDPGNLIATKVETSKKKLIERHGLTPHEVYHKGFPLEENNKIFLEVYPGE